MPPCIPPTNLLPALVDEIANEEPHRVWAEIPQNDCDLSKGFHKITFRILADIVNELCHLLYPKLGTSTKFRTVAYFGPADPSWTIIMLTLQKLGHKLLCSAPRNSLDMHLNLMEMMECDILLTAPGGMDVGPIVEAKQQMTVHEIPGLKALLRCVLTDQPKLFPYEKEYNDETKMEPLVVLHTSGSTGLPKPIIIRHEFSIRAWRQCFLEPYEGMISMEAELSKPARWYMSFPPWHGASLMVFGANTCLYGKMTSVYGPSHLTATGDVALDILKHADVDRMLVPPAQVQALYRTDGGMEAISKLKMVGTAGGSLDSAVGSAISKVTLVFTAVGTTEASLPAAQYFHKDPSLWNYIYFLPDCPGYCFRRTDESKAAELVLRRSIDFNTFAPVFATFRHLREWPTKDLYLPHPDPAKCNLWKHEARTDDLIVFADAQKLNPLSFEESIRTNPLVSNALVIGTNRVKAALLVELEDGVVTSTLDRMEAVLESIGETIEEANKKAPKHGRVGKGMVILARRARPFRKASKGTVQRVPTVQDYATEIEELYKASEISQVKAT